MLVNPAIYFAFQLLMDAIGRRKSLQLATLLVWASSVALWGIDDYLIKMISLGLVTGGDGAFITLFILGMNEATRKLDSNSEFLTVQLSPRNSDPRW